MATIRDLQARLHALGYNPGVIDGIDGPKTQSAYIKAKAARGRKGIFEKHGLHRVHLHWTAGAYGDIALERRAYNLLVLEDGKVVMGDYAPEANASTSDGRYAAHTRAANSGAIGVALDGMHGARENPFFAGPFPITAVQVRKMAQLVADLCDTYDIPVTRYSVLTHAEIEPTLGIKQRNKWDIRWLPGMPRAGGAIEVGDKIRELIKAEL